MAVSGDGRVLAVETLSVDAAGYQHPRGVTLRDPTTLAIRRRLPPLTLPALTTWLNRDGSLLLATADLDNHVELWDTRTGHRRWQTDIGYPEGQAIALSPNSRTLVVGTFGGAVVLLDIATGRVLARHSLRLSAQIWSADFTPDGAVVALGGNDGQVHLLTADTLHEIGQLPDRHRRHLGSRRLHRRRLGTVRSGRTRTHRAVGRPAAVLDPPRLRHRRPRPHPHRMGHLPARRPSPTHLHHGMTTTEPRRRGPPFDPRAPTQLHTTATPTALLHSSAAA